jgi:chromosome partitioning protein
MRTLATVNHKGGSGKTTTAVNVAAALAETGRRVLLIDLDPQASATRWLGVLDGGRVLLDTLCEERPLQEAIAATSHRGVELVPSSTWLLTTERALIGQARADQRLATRLAESDARWDYVIVDCPPALGLLTVNAFAAVGELLIPVEAHYMALEGFAQLTQAIESARKRLNPRLHIGGIVACRVDSRTRHCPEVVEELRSRFGSVVYPTVIRENVRLAECPSFRKPITEYDPRSSGTLDYRDLARDIIYQEAHHGAAA